MPPNIESLIIKLEDHINESERRLNTLCASVDKINIEMSQKVSYKNFTWIIGILISVLMTMFGYIASQINDIQKASISTEKNVSLIQGKLEPYNVEFKN
jgi:hypothetical protein